MTTLPILGAGITVLFFERHFGFSGLSGLCLDAAGDVVAFQHLFWFFGHPEVYVIVLPAWSFSLRFEHCSSYWPLFIFAKCYLFAFKIPSASLIVLLLGIAELTPCF